MASLILQGLLVCLYYSVTTGGDLDVMCPQQTLTANGINSQQFCFVLNSSNWSTSEYTCRRLGGHLASVLNKQEGMRLFSQIEVYPKNLTCGSRWWIGLKRTGVNFAWSDKSKFIYMNWRPKNKSNTDQKKNCGYLKVQARKTRWITDACSKEYCFVCKSEWTGVDDSNSLAGAIGGSVAGAFITMTIVVVVVVVLYVYCRRRKPISRQQQLVESQHGEEECGVNLPNPNYDGLTSHSHTVGGSAHVLTTQETANDTVDMGQVYNECQKTVETSHADSSSYAYAYASTSGKSRSQEQQSNFSSNLQYYDTPCQVFHSNERNGDIYWEPAGSVEKLYAQFEGKRFRRILRSEILIHETIGSGQFGTVAKGTWKGFSSETVVAVKMLNSSSEEDRVRFLQEGAIMGQFKHNNIVALRGLVLEGEPLMMAVELMENGDLKKHLQSLSGTPALSSRLLRMAREIAAGMKYLSHKAFIHRDLAVRNVMLDCQFTCKIGDFGLSRDLNNGEYYITHGGMIPVRWTAPEAIMYRKYSAFSDVWSYGIVLHEIWTVGQRPYHHSWSNNYVIEMLEAGYRLPPPPGCSHSIYKLMIKCWHPDRHQRPKFDEVVAELDVDDDELLLNGPDVEPIRGRLGEEVDTDDGCYDDLQNAYKGMDIVN